MNEFVIISKDVFEEMVGKFNRFSDRVNEILGKREEGRLSRWMDNQDVCPVALRSLPQITRLSAGKLPSSQSE